MNHNKLIKKYFEASKDKGKSGNVFFEGSILYSYGHHFILALKCKNGYILNGDRYSMSTAKHQSYTRRNAPDNSPIIPISALQNIIEPELRYNLIEQFKNIEIIDKTEDTYETVKRKDKDGNEYDAQIHHLGASLIKYDNKYYLSSIDPGSKNFQYFLVQLKGKPQTVKDAFRDLAGNLNDIEYNKYLEGEIKRQGEYFLIPTIEKTNILKTNSKDGILKNYDLSNWIGNMHTSTEAIITKDNTYIRGTLRHRQHKMISLGNIWYIVKKNTAKQSWQSGGRVD